jgi:hypothetical protein
LVEQAVFFPVYSSSVSRAESIVARKQEENQSINFKCLAMIFWYPEKENIDHAAIFRFVTFLQTP